MIYIKDAGINFYYIIGKNNIIFDAGIVKSIDEINVDETCRGYFTMNKVHFVCFRKLLASKFKLDKTMIMHDLRIMDAQMKFSNFNIEYRGSGNKARVAMEKLKAKPDGSKDYSDGLAHFTDLVDLLISYEAR